MKNFPNVILVSGTGRNVGKTNFVCHLIEQLSFSLRIIALKISPHFHDEISKNEILYQTPKMLVQKETNTKSQKDSSRMLKAGASEVFYIQVEDEHMSEIIEFLERFNLTTCPVICESASLRRLIKPGIFFFVDNFERSDSDKNYDLRVKADIQLHSIQGNISFNTSNLRFEDYKWLLVN